MMAVIATFFSYPAAIRAPYFCIISKLNLMATSAGMNIAWCRLGRPPKIRALPCHFPELCDIGARPARLPTCLLVRLPISGMSTKIISAVFVPFHGMLINCSIRFAMFWSLRATSNICASILSMSPAMWRSCLSSWALINSTVLVALRVLAAVRSLIKARRAASNSLRS